METLFLYGRKFPDIKSQQNTQIYNGHDFISCFTINSLNAVNYCCNRKLHVAVQKIMVYSIF